MKRTTYYIVAIVLLLGANGYMLLADSSSGKKALDRHYFQSEDLAAVSKLVFNTDANTVSMSKAGEGWKLNELYKVDEGFFNTLLSVLERVEVNRKISDWEGTVLGSAEVEFDFNSRYRFDFGTNATRTKSYFITEDEVFEVAVPGYRDNVVEIFMLHPDQWRDRLVIDGSWRTIQKAALAYTDRSGDFEITFDDKFFLVNGTTPTDSSAVVDYLNQFQYFQANEMLSTGRFPRLDSLAGTPGLATLTIDDIKLEAPMTLNIYPNLPGQSYHLVVDDKGQKMVIDAARIADILKSANDFEVK